MIDIFDSLYTHCAQRLREAHSGIFVTGDLTIQATKFPCVAIDETSNLPTELSSANRSKYARVVIRSKVYTTGSNKKAAARKILATLDEALEESNFFRASYAALPDAYQASVYTIDVTYTAIVRDDGAVFRAVR